jgi:hypothetical protein
MSRESLSSLLTGPAPGSSSTRRDGIHALDGTIYSRPVMTRNTGAQILANPATSAERLTLRRAGKPVIVKVDPATP